MVLYEINTWVWLGELTRKYGRTVTLADVPAEEWDGIARWGFDSVWLMGVWERSPAGAKIAREHPGLASEFAAALPDLTSADVIGSPYAVHRYVVDAHLGGQAALAIARRELAARGLRLLLDFVPNHVAVDHSWTIEHPGYFVHDQAGIANGRDPYFPPWTDTAQLNIFRPETRQALLETLLDIGEQCDGVRCDMSILLLNDVFSRTWGGNAPATEFWGDVIPIVRARIPEFILMAEAYWDLEYTMQQLGFDYCYDKRLYDGLVHGDAYAIRLHLTADLHYQNKLIRFLENHDEPRAAAVLPPEKLRAAVVVAATLPGAKLFHEGQLEGRRIKLPVQLARRAAEPADTGLENFYQRVLKAAGALEGDWQLCETSGWPDNPSHTNLLAWTWSGFVIVVNYSSHPAQGRIKVGQAVSFPYCRLTDQITGEIFDREGNELQAEGLFVNLAPWQVHFLRFDA
ncbi:MAG TPA: alpha-amylase family glycosyl hydrolase [Bryobacteraceae bacterium]|nr:alpha-amylase family glycosyl hydrolase [Bryobacteraceae bacterium]